MADPRAIVGMVEGVQDTGGGVQPQGGIDDQPVSTVRFADAQTAVLDTRDRMYDVYRETLTTLSRIRRPAYVEVSDGDIITDVLIPVVARVRGIMPLPAGGFHVRLDVSSARHTVSAAEPEHGPLLTLLQQSLQTGARLAITADQIDHSIFDAREVPPGVAPPASAAPSVAGPPVIEAISVVPRERAVSLFNEMKAESCTLASPPDCIPFLFPDSGCWARAHRMHQLMAAQNVAVGKLWIFGELTVRTRNHPKCRVHWDWHVAPVVRVEPSRRLWVIDPSLFHRPVLATTWARAQGDPGATMAITGPSVFFLGRPQPGQREDSVPEGRDETADFLELFQRELRRRIRRTGAPPYRCRSSSRAVRRTTLVCEDPAAAKPAPV